MKLNNSIKTIILSLIILISPMVFSEDKIIGEVIKIRGKAYRIQEGETSRHPLAVNSKIYLKDQVNTLASSFVKIKMKDRTKINIAQKSHFEFKDFELSDDRRTTVYQLISGKIRAHVQGTIGKNNTVKFGTRLVSIGVRGTEFLTNAYMASGKPTTDGVLLEGKIDADISKLEIGPKNAKLEPGQAFNSTKIKNTGDLSSIKNLSPESLSSLNANAEGFLPNFQAPDGKFLDMDSVIQSAFKSVGEALPSVRAVGTVGSIAVSTLIGKEKEKPVPVVIRKTNKNTDKALKDEPEDIRDAILRQKELRAKNVCFYWFYKPIPGRGGLERFRREEECQDD